MSHREKSVKRSHRRKHRNNDASKEKREVKEPALLGQRDALTDADAELLAKIWKDAFPDAAVLPVIGFPSKSGGVVTLTHTMGGPPMTINGLASKSPLANNALYSSEISEGKPVNLYETMLLEIPGKNGDPSTVQIYVNTLSSLDLDVAGNHYHWTGALVMGKPVYAIHHQNAGMDPVTFSQKTIHALKVATAVIAERM